MKQAAISILSIFLAFTCNADRVDPNAAVSKMMYEQKIADFERYEAEKSAQEFLIRAQREEIQKILFKDPWRKIGNSTNLVNATGWVEFQGRVQSVGLEGVLLKGRIGKVLSIWTTTDGRSSQRTTQTKTSINSSQSKYRFQSNENTFQTTDSSLVAKIVYGDDFFLVDNFPYPAQVGDGYERLMALDVGYYTFTNASQRVLTVRKLDYGTPCVKTWTPEEIDAAKQKVDAAKKKQSDKILKHNQDLADKGDPVGLQRMGERYRDGDGVEKDLAKAKEYFDKSEAARIEIAKQMEKQKEDSAKADLQNKIDWAKDQAEKGAVSGMLFLGKAYRDGTGVEKDLSKAKEYFSKASQLGSKEAAKLFIECEKLQ